ncbi:MAG: hypothetical protein ACK5NY_06770 [Burkholderiaceae bacterium]|jgi:hypothetical protein
MDNILPANAINTAQPVAIDITTPANAPILNALLLQNGSQALTALLSALVELNKLVPNAVLQLRLSSITLELDTPLAFLKMVPQTHNSKELASGSDTERHAAELFAGASDEVVKFLQGLLTTLSSITIPTGAFDKTHTTHTIYDGMINNQGAQALALQQAAMREGSSLLSTLQEMRRRHIIDRNRKPFPKSRKVPEITPGGLESN